MDEPSDNGANAEMMIEIICRNYCINMGFDPDKQVNIPTGLIDQYGQQQMLRAPLWKTLRPNAVSTLAWHRAIKPFI